MILHSWRSDGISSRSPTMPTAYRSQWIRKNYPPTRPIRTWENMASRIDWLWNIKRPTLLVAHHCLGSGCYLRANCRLQTAAVVLYAQGKMKTFPKCQYEKGVNYTHIPIRTVYGVRLWDCVNFCDHPLYIMSDESTSPQMLLSNQTMHVSV